MKDDGYTLAEALAAMLILALAVGGLVEGAQALARLQRSADRTVADGRAASRAEAALSALLRYRSPDDRSLTGDRRGFSFDCAKGRCGVDLKRGNGRTVIVIRRGEVARSFSLPASGNVALVYDAREGRYSHWPPSNVHATLRGVSVVASSALGDTPLVAARSWIEHPRTCEFDAIAGECRQSAP